MGRKANRARARYRGSRPRLHYRVRSLLHSATFCHPCFCFACFPLPPSPDSSERSPWRGRPPLNWSTLAFDENRRRSAATFYHLRHVLVRSHALPHVTKDAAALWLPTETAPVSLRLQRDHVQHTSLTSRLCTRYSSFPHSTALRSASGIQSLVLGTISAIASCQLSLPCVAARPFHSPIQ